MQLVSIFIDQKLQRCVSDASFSSNDLFKQSVVIQPVQVLRLIAIIVKLCACVIHHAYPRCAEQQLDCRGIRL